LLKGAKYEHNNKKKGVGGGRGRPQGFLLRKGKKFKEGEGGGKEKIQAIKTKVFAGTQDESLIERGKKKDFSIKGGVFRHVRQR